MWSFDVVDVAWGNCIAWVTSVLTIMVINKTSSFAKEICHIIRDNSRSFLTHLVQKSYLSANPYAFERNKWGSEGARSNEWGGCGNRSHFCILIMSRMMEVWRQGALRVAMSLAHVSCFILAVLCIQHHQIDELLSVAISIDSFSQFGHFIIYDSFMVPTSAETFLFWSGFNVLSMLIPHQVKITTFCVWNSRSKSTSHRL